MQTFRSPNRGPLGTIAYSTARFLRAPDGRIAGLPVELGNRQSLPMVEIVYAHANMTAHPIEAAVAAGAQGIVLAGVGNGNASRTALAALARAVQEGVIVVRASRTGSGFVARNVEIDDDRVGSLAAGWHSAVKARVLLQVVLTRTTDPAQIQRLLLRDLAPPHG